MRNLKRALSLALASVMLLGMMVVGSSAANVEDFTDVDSINNYEAVSIATGLGIFDGYDDGSFGPEKVVTRAEAAVVISKILYGADVNPANFVGTAKFTDVPAWAEGWVNLAYTNNIIVGYDEKTFGPNDPVTTAQFATMLLKALGYYNNGVDVLDADWELTVTAKANGLGIYGDLALPMSEGLTRENVAEMAFNALFAQRVAFNDYRGQYVKTNDRDVVVTNGTADPSNTLAQNVFGLYTTEGVVIANGMTDEDLAASVKSAAMTTVKFAEEADLDQDGKFEIAEDETYDFTVDTGLDMIGHAVKIYYTIEKKAPVVFAIIDEATLVSVIDYDVESEILADAANDAGFKKNTILNITESEYFVNYDLDVKYDESFDLDKLIVISNSSDKEVDCVIALDQFLTKVDTIDEDDDVVEYVLESGSYDMAIALDDVAEGDFVIATVIGNLDEVVVFEPATVMSADITKLTGVSNSTADIKKVIADGETYIKSSVTPYDGDDFKEFAAITTIGSAILVVDQFGDLVGLTTTKAAPKYAYVAQYGVIHSTGALNTTFALTAHVYFADGTDGIYTVKGYEKLDEYTAHALADALNAGFGQGLDKNLDQKRASGALGLWDASVSGTKVTLKVAKDVEETANGTDGAAADKVSIVKGLSTLVLNKTSDDRQAVAGLESQATLYQNNDTVYFYVDGKYVEGEGQDVTVITGIKNVMPFENGENKEVENSGIQQLFSLNPAKAGGRQTVGAVLATDAIAGVEDDTIYFYNAGNYHITKNSDGDVILTYDMFTLDGKAVEVSYEFETVAAAKAEAEAHFDGFYLAKTAGLEVYKDVLADTDYNEGTYVGLNVSNKTYYVVNDIAEYDEYVDNLYAFYNIIGNIAEDVVIVDACDSGITSVSKLIRAITNKDVEGQVYISYVYSLKDYVIDVLFINTYDPVKVEAPGSAGDKVTATFDAVSYNSEGVLSFEGTAPEKAVKVVVETYSAISGEWKTFFDGVVKAVDGEFTVKLPANPTYLADIKVTVDGKEATLAD